MKTNNVITKSLLVASLAVLGACGGGDGGGGGRPKTVVVAPTPGNASSDYILQSVIPMLQQQYGSVILQQQVQLVGRTLPAGTYTWANLYQSYILASVTGSNCQISSNNHSNILSPWGTLNYNCFQSAAYPYVNQWSYTPVQFEYFRYSNSQTSFLTIFNWILSTANSYAMNSYYPSYGGTNYYTQYPSYNYNPQMWNCPNTQSYYVGNSGIAYLNLSLIFAI